MTKMLFRDTLRTVRKRFSRYVSILLIVALGTAFFTGIKATAPDMFATAKEYFTQYNLMDIRIQSSAGLTAEDVEAVKRISGIEYAKGEKFVDALVRVNGEIETDIDGTQISTRAYGISPADIANFLNGVDDGNYINRVQLIEGKYPSSASECLVDASDLSTPDSFVIGSKITLEKSGGEAPNGLSGTEFTIVGIVRSPYYISFERGNTNIGSGKIGTYILIPDEAFSTDYYTEIYAKVQGSDSYEPFSEEYYNYIEPYEASVKALSDTQVKQRVTVLKPQLLKQIEDGERSISEKSADATTAMKELDTTIETLQSLVDNGEKLLADAQEEFDKQFADAENTISGNSAQLEAALKDYQTKYELWQASKEQYEESTKTLAEKQEQYDTLYAECTTAQQQVNSLNTAISTTNSLINTADQVMQTIKDSNLTASSQEQVQAIISMMQTTYPELYNSIKELTSHGLAMEIIAGVEPYIEQQKRALADQEKQIKEKKAVLDALAANLETMKTTLEKASADSASTKKKLDQAATDLANYKDELTSKGISIQSGELQLQIRKIQEEAKLKELTQQVKSAPANLAEAQKKRDEANAQLTSSLAAAKAELSDAKELYARLDNVKWSVYDRSATPGYSSYGQSVQNIAALSNIFPVFFFIIAALVCLTTMTRLVDEERVLLGTYKALGYTSGAVMLKYIIYSLSACLFGTILGVSLAVFMFPFAINSAYGIMYSMPPLVYKIPWPDILVCFGASLLCTTIATVAALTKELKLAPSVLMRPKAPKPGKRILLERISLLWKKLSFSAKVTARNLFRNKSRFLMTVLGIAGCCALILASLGMFDSVSAIVTKQYGENAISKYDFQIAFDNAQTAGTHTAAFNTAAADSRIKSLALIAMKSMEGFGENSGKKTDVYVFVPEKPSELPEFIDLRNRKTGEKITLDDSGAVITEKLAKDAGVQPGGIINFSDSDGNTYSVKVSAVAENYTFHYIYMTDAVYRAATSHEPEYFYAIGLLSDSILSQDADAAANAKGRLASDMVLTEGVTALAYTADTTQSISRITQALSWVILLFVVSAAVLAIVVLYNLSNINIIERNRELATLKVLGFTDREMNAYIYRENIIVSVFGLVLGVALGIGLHRLLIEYTSIDAVMYGQYISWYNYIVSCGLTVLFIVLVNLVLKKKIKRIDMVTSLKSVE